MDDDIYANVEDSGLEGISSAQIRTQTAVQAKKRNAETAPPLPHRPPGAADGYCRWTAVCLGVLCILLLGLSIGLAVWLQTERDHPLTNHSDLVEERDQLLTNQSKLLQERDQLLTNQSKFLQERDHLLTNYCNLLQDRDHLLTKHSNLLEKRLQCPAGWELFGCNCYHVKRSRRTWSESRLHCQSLGGDLLIIKTPEKQRFITEKNYAGWIGMRKGNDGTWRWIDDTPVMTWYWKPGQPDGTSSYCVKIRGRDSTSQNWHDLSCQINAWSICEKSAI